MSSRQPTLILRESCIDDATQSWLPGSFLEVGAGTGYMTSKFLNCGFHGACYDLGEESRQRLRGNLAAYRDRMAVVDDLAFLSPASFDYLFAFEVLEHIEDDQAALRDWTRYLKPNGRFLLTVPAPMATATSPTRGRCKFPHLSDGTKGTLVGGCVLRNAGGGLLQPPALAVELEEVAVVHETVEQRPDHHHVAEQRGPVLETAV
jgi:SAM-dependent methyltransferase